MTASYLQIKNQLLHAAMVHVPFDGWSEATFQAAVRDTGIDLTMSAAVCPRGAVDLAIAYHHRGDALMLESLQDVDFSEMRFRDRVATAVRFRLEAVGDKEAVRRATTLFALPTHAGDGAKLIWSTVDQIWSALGDSSEDVNWYTKRATLGAVYSATILYWLGDNDPDSAATWEFLDRRIDNVMQIEKLKIRVKKSSTLTRLMAGPYSLLDQIRAPQKTPEVNLPGSWRTPRR